MATAITSRIENGPALFQDAPSTDVEFLPLESFFAGRMDAVRDNGSRYDSFYHPENVIAEFFGLDRHQDQEQRRPRLWTRR